MQDFKQLWMSMNFSHTIFGWGNYYGEVSDLGVRAQTWTNFYPNLQILLIIFGGMQFFVGINGN